MMFSFTALFAIAYDDYSSPLLDDLGSYDASLVDSLYEPVPKPVYSGDSGETDAKVAWELEVSSYAEEYAAEEYAVEEYTVEEYDYDADEYDEYEENAEGIEALGAYMPIMPFGNMLDLSLTGPLTYPGRAPVTADLARGQDFLVDLDVTRLAAMPAALAWNTGFFSVYYDPAVVEFVQVAQHPTTPFNVNFGTFRICVPGGGAVPGRVIVQSMPLQNFLVNIDVTIALQFRILDNAPIGAAGTPISVGINPLLGQGFSGNDGINFGVDMPIQISGSPINTVVAPEFTPVTNITGVPTTKAAGTSLALEGTVVPANATNPGPIVWSVVNAGGTGATISGNTLSTTAAGTVTVRATIENGLTATTDYTQDFTIDVTAFIPVTDIVSVPSTKVVNVPLALSGTVWPANATNRDPIVWEIFSAGTTGATITGNTLNTTSGGTVVVRARIVNGASATSDFTAYFTITVFVPVTDITGVPNTTVAGVPLTLTGTVEPANATNSAIVWSVFAANGTGAAITGNTLSTTAAGTVVVRATVVNGLTATTDYIQNFIIDVTAFIPVTDITGVPTAAEAGVPLPLTGTAEPNNATTPGPILWSVVNAGTTGATITGDTLNATAGGSVTIRATIVNGASATTNFTQDFTITVAAFVPVTSITGVPNTAEATVPLALTGTVAPANATNSTIVWEVASAGTTGATITGDTLNTTAVGTVMVRARVVNGLLPTADFTAYFPITVTPTFVPVTSITGVPNTTVAGIPLTLTGTVAPANATNSTIVWSVEAAGVTGATITGNTLYTTSPGSAVVRATVVNGLTATTDFTTTFTISVTLFEPVTSITGVPNTVFVNDPLTLSGTVAPANATTQSPILWSVVSGPATIAGDILTATAGGTVVVRATIVNGASATTNFTEDFNITVFVPVTDITGVPTAAVANVPLTLSGTVVPSDATNTTIVWSVVSGPANITGGDTLTATAAGSVVVRATIVNGATPTSNFMEDFTINVTSFVPVTDITGVPNMAYVNVPLTLTGTVEPNNATNTTIIWSVESGSANITGGNTLTATATGSVVVRATIVNGATPTSNFTEDFTINVTSFVPVTDITGVPNMAYVNVPLTLSGTVVPNDATNSTIVWSVFAQGSTGATISGNTLSASSPGSVIVLATITNGLTPTSDYVQEFTITVFAPVSGITGVPTTTVAGVPLTLTGTVAPGNATNTAIVWEVVPVGTTAAGATITGNTLSTAAGTGGTVVVRATIVNGIAVGTDFVDYFTITVTPTMRTVTFNLDGGTRTGGGALSQQVPHGGAATAPTVSRAGHTFAGWNIAFTNVTSNITVIAQWTAVPVQTHTVTFNLNGGTRTDGGALVQTVTHGGSATVPTVSRAGHTFAGWSPVLNLTNVTENRTFTAQWTPVTPPAQTHTVSFNLNGGTRTGGGALVQTVTHGGNATAPTVSRAGHTFAGWSPVLNLTNVTSARTFTAQWTPITQQQQPAVQTHTITFNLNGGTQAVGESSALLLQNVERGSDGVMIDDPTRAGYDFAGWTASPAGATVTNVQRNIAFTASWTSVTPPADPGAEPDDPRLELEEYEDIDDEEIPLAEYDEYAEYAEYEEYEEEEVAEADGWALASLIFAALGVVLAAVTAIVAAVGKDKERNANVRARYEGALVENRGVIRMIVVLVMAVAGVVAFFITNDMSNNMIIANVWTILSAAIFAIEAIAVAIRGR